MRRRLPDADDDHVSETDVDDVENDENRPVADAPDARRRLTPLSHARPSHDTPLRDITDQFFHPPSPSPVRVAKLKRAAPPAEPPRRPKKPKSQTFPADPPNWLYARSSSSLPPSSPLPPSTANVDHRRPTAVRHAYYLGTPTSTSDSDPFGFVAVERALKAKRADPPLPPAPRLSALKSPPRSTVLPSIPVFSSSSPLDAPVPTNNEDIDGLYADEPVPGPSHVHVPAAPLLLMNSDRPLAEVDATRSQPTFPDPLRTPRKRRRRPSPADDVVLDLDDQGTDVPSSPSPVKISVPTGPHAHHRRPTAARSSHTPVLKLTRAQTRAAGRARPTTPHGRTAKTSHQHIPTPSSTRPSTSPRQSTAPSTPVPPRRSTRQAAVGARAKLRSKGSTASDEENRGGDGAGRMILRSRSAKTKPSQETKTTKAGRAKHPPSRSKTSPKAQKTAARPARGRPRGKASTKDAKGKGKARPLESVLDLSDDTRVRYEKERRERLEYFKRLEGYQMQKENVYVV